MTDPCKILGIEPGASAEEVKQAYRRKTKQLHPDNKETGDHDKFVELQKAYEQMKDGAPKPRQQRSGWRSFSGGQGWWDDPNIQFSTGDTTFSGFHFYQHAPPEQNLHVRESIPLSEAVPGKIREFDVHFNGKFLHGNFSIPDNVADGMRITVPCQEPSIANFTILLNIVPPPGFGVLGRDLVHTHNINGITACIGGTFLCQHPNGRKWNIGVPSGTADGDIVKLRGQGITGRGDLRIQFRIVPEDLSQHREDIEKILQGN